jgi:hypothetical protein
MLHFVKSNRAYDPETVAVMTAAFNEACQSLSVRITCGDDVRHRLAEAILRRVDQGQRDPVMIAAAAMSQLTGVDGQ